MASFRRASPATQSTEGLKLADGFADGRRAPGTLSARGSTGKRGAGGCDILASRPPFARDTGGLAGADIPFTVEKPLESSAFPLRISGIAFYYFQEAQIVFLI